MQCQDHANSRTILAVHYRAWDLAGREFLKDSSRLTYGKPLVNDSGAFLAVAPLLLLM